MTQVPQWVKKLLEEASNEEHLSIGMITINPENNMKVKIIDGQYWGEFGVSNFWVWKEVLADGSLGEVEYSGYGWIPVDQ